MEANLMELGIATVRDLLFTFPFRYEDHTITPLEEAAHEERVTVEGVVHSEPALQYYRAKKSKLTLHLLVGRVLVKVHLFNQPFLKKKIEPNQTIMVSGKWDRYRQSITASYIRFEQNDSPETFEPVYHVTKGIKLHDMRKYIANALETYGEQVEEILPAAALKKYGLLPRAKALNYLHQPANESELKQARRRFVYEEFFLFQLKMQALRKLHREAAEGVAKPYDKQKLRSFVDSLPFTLTTAQKRVVREILHDMEAPYRMNRLLQGDVGSGKTLVAAIAMYSACTSGVQTALLAPTEILSEQHADTLQDWFASYGMEVALLTSRVKGVRRRTILERLQNGETDMIIGTHALIQEDVSFANLGLVITDEQHRFGVNQRRVLREKGYTPDVLFMTATPIPRTLAITAFGEMDTSIIDELPKGRKPIDTLWAKKDEWDQVLEHMKQELRKGRQAYVICPLIEESETLDVQNAVELHGLLAEALRKEAKVGLMHGRLHGDEKDETMRAFADGEIGVLVSTTVVEVGVNVPNATFMLIYDAERFGLSQLHQLRGRVGRGSDQSYCVLIAEPKTEIGQERMRIMTETTNGFELSERDLELRGPGDFFGKKQSGVPSFQVGDPVHDYRILEAARKDAQAIVQEERFWTDDAFESLRKTLPEEVFFD